MVITKFLIDTVVWFFVYFFFFYTTTTTTTTTTQEDEEKDQLIMLGNIVLKLQMKENEKEFSEELANVLESMPEVLEVPPEMQTIPSNIEWHPTKPSQYSTETDSSYSSYSSSSEEDDVDDDERRQPISQEKNPMEVLPVRIPLAVYGKNGTMTFDTEKILEIVDVDGVEMMMQRNMRGQRDNLTDAAKSRFDFVCKNAVNYCGFILKAILRTD